MIGRWLVLLLALVGWIAFDAARRAEDARVAHDRRALAAAERRIYDVLAESEVRWPALVGPPERHPFASAADYQAAIDAANDALAWEAARTSSAPAAVVSGWLVQRIGDRVRARRWAPVAREIAEASGVIADPDGVDGARFLPGLLGGRVSARPPAARSGVGLWLDVGRVVLAALAAGLAMREVLRVRHEREREQAREAVLQRISHELRTPAASIRSLSEALVSGAAAGEDEQRRFLAHLGAEAERLAVGIDRLLRAARGQAEVRVAPVRLDLAEWVHGVGERWRRHLPALIVETPGSLAAYVDPERLDEALDALLDNAAKHGGAAVALRAAQVGREIRISVEDDGPGVPPADRRRVFERLQRVEGRAGDAGGYGLGLWAASEVARAHGGRLTLEGGSRFVLTLPEAP